MEHKAEISRRDLLKAALLAGGAITLAPFVKGCAPSDTPATTSTSTALAVPTEDSLLAGLSGLQIDAFFQDAYRRWMGRDPENLTTLGLADAWGVGDASLTDISDTGIRRTQALEQKLLTVLRAYDRTSFSETQSLTADVFDWFLDDLVRGHAFMYDDYPVNPTVTSIPYNLFMLFTVYHPLNSLQDADDYIARLEQVGTKLDQLVDGLRRRDQRGVVLPLLFFDFVLPDLKSVASVTAASHPYFTAFTGRLSGVSEQEQTALSAKVLSAIENTVRPAYRALCDFLNAQRAKAPNGVGVWQFADGEGYYEQCLRRHTTTGLSAEEIHQLGLENLERIQAEMRPLFANLGYPASDSILQLYQRLTADSGVYRGQQAVAAYEQAIRQAEALAPQAFSTLPRAGVKVIGGKDGDYYMPASFDGSRPGLFFARTNGNLPRYWVKTTGFHETVPGHHLHIALAQETPDLPDLRRGMQFNAYVEGWALYAERLISELGAYADDPAGDLGRLQMEAYRAARLVVDTGIHAKRWSFSQAANYLAEAIGFPVQAAQSETARYSVWPGQATSYYIGFLKLLELRRKAQDALGSRFDLKAFHETVLANGAVPIPILERIVDGYIRAQA